MSKLLGNKMDRHQCDNFLSSFNNDTKKFVRTYERVLRNLSKLIHVLTYIYISVYEKNNVKVKFGNDMTFKRLEFETSKLGKRMQILITVVGSDESSRISKLNSTIFLILCSLSHSSHYLSYILKYSTRFLWSVFLQW